MEWRKVTKPDFRKKMFGPKFGEKGAKKAKNEVKVVERGAQMQKSRYNVQKCMEFSIEF